MVGRWDIRLRLPQFVTQIEQDRTRLVPGEALGDARIGHRPYLIGRISTRQVSGNLQTIQTYFGGGRGQGTGNIEHTTPLSLARRAYYCPVRPSLCSRQALRTVSGKTAFEIPLHSKKA
jgi:hypothetical protein